MKNWKAVGVRIVLLLIAVAMLWSIGSNVIKLLAFYDIYPKPARMRVYDPNNIFDIYPRATDIFMGRVVKQLDTVEKGPFRYVNFSVEPIFVLKGHPEKVVTVTQQGLMPGVVATGLSNYGGGEATGGRPKLDQDTLMPGQTHLFFTVWWKEFSSYEIFDSPVARRKLGAGEVVLLEASVIGLKIILALAAGTLLWLIGKRVVKDYKGSRNGEISPNPPDTLSGS